MLNNFHICRAGGDAIIPILIIAATIIAQLIKAGKRAAKGSAPPSDSQGRRSTSSAPQDELKNFLESLVGNAPPAPAPPAPPPVPPPQAHAAPPSPPSRERLVQMDTPTAKLRAKPSRRAKPRPAHTPVTASRIAVKPHPSTPTHDAYAMGNTISASQLRTELLADLSQVDSLRKAIVLREIIGPSLAMR